jgi:hypothetical protein
MNQYANWRRSHRRGFFGTSPNAIALRESGPFPQLADPLLGTIPALCGAHELESL